MPIRRWHGWAAVCPRCGSHLELGEGLTAFESRSDVRDSLDVITTIDAAILDACGCERRAEDAKRRTEAK